MREDVASAQQQQSTEDKTELCVGVQPPDNYKMRGSKQELIATTHKMTQIEEMSEYCISKMAQANEETDKQFSTTTRTIGQQGRILH